MQFEEYCPPIRVVTRKQRSYKKLLLTLFIPIPFVIFCIVILFQGNGNFAIPLLSSDDAKAAEDTPPKQTYFWKPPLDQIVSRPGVIKPELSAKAALAINLDTDKVYYIKEPQTRLPMASITKVMTALLTKEHAKLADLFSVSEYAASIGENSIGVTAGEKYTVDELLWALFLKSANDASEVIAENIAGSKAGFVKLMNKHAIELGMNNTNYTNPYGLEGDGTMYTTAEDIAIITKYAIFQYPELLDYSKTIEHMIEQNANHKAVWLSSEIDLIRTYPGAVGFKTGYTDEAGKCIITIAENNGVRIMVIVLGSKDRRVDAVKLLDYAYEIEGLHIKHQPFW